MGEPIHTRRELRRRIGRQAGIEFFMKYGDALTADTNSSTTVISNSKLSQEDGYWDRTFFYDADEDETVPVQHFSNTLKLEYPLSTSAATHSFELFDIWTPDQIHDALNQAIEEGAQEFPEVDSQAFVVEANKLVYDVSSYGIKHIHEIRLRASQYTHTGFISSSPATTTVVVTVDLTNYAIGDYISIYSGTGSGQYRTITALDKTTKVITTTAWTTRPDSTSEFRIWKPNEDQRDDMRIANARFDMNQYPNSLYLRGHSSAHYGYLMEIVFTAKEDVLSSDTDETVVPLGFLVPRVMALLFEMSISNTRVDTSKYTALVNHYNQIAADFKQRNRWQAPINTQWSTPLNSDPLSYDEDPLGWR